MTFDQIKDGSIIYLDANVLVYHFARKSSECTQLIQRCKDERVFGITSVFTLGEFCHRAMYEEAYTYEGIAKPNKAYFKEHPEVVRRLHRYSVAMEDIVQRSNITILSASETDILKSQHIRSTFGMMTNDSLIVWMMLTHRIPVIATNDPDFERVKGIQVFKPSDI